MPSAHNGSSAAPKPVSERRLRANRSNAKKSTGPRSAEGKARSSLNARKHGIFCEASTRSYRSSFAAALLAREPRLLPHEVATLSTLLARRHLVDARETVLLCAPYDDRTSLAPRPSTRFLIAVAKLQDAGRHDEAERLFTLRTAPPAGEHDALLALFSGRPRRELLRVAAYGRRTASALNRELRAAERRIAAEASEASAASEASHVSAADPGTRAAARVDDVTLPPGAPRRAFHRNSPPNVRTEGPGRRSRATSARKDEAASPPTTSCVEAEAKPEHLPEHLPEALPEAASALLRVLEKQSQSENAKHHSGLVGVGPATRDEAAHDRHPQHRGHPHEREDARLGNREPVYVGPPPTPDFSDGDVPRPPVVLHRTPQMQAHLAANPGPASWPDGPPPTAASPRTHFTGRGTRSDPLIKQPPRVWRQDQAVVTVDPTSLFTSPKWRGW